MRQIKVLDIGEAVDSVNDAGKRVKLYPVNIEIVKDGKQVTFTGRLIMTNVKDVPYLKEVDWANG